MKRFGISMERLCQVVVEGANGDGWCQATVAVGYLRGEVRAEDAIRLYLHWGARTEPIADRRRHPEDVRVDRGKKCIVFRCLSLAKGCGLLVSQGPPGGRREYRLTKKGRKLLKGADLCQP